EVPYEVMPAGGPAVWIHDFCMVRADGHAVDLRAGKERFQDAFGRVWSGAIESDGLNRLVLAAGLGWRQVVVLRLFARYLRQVGTPFSQAYMEETLAKFPKIAAAIVALFEARFDPDAPADAAGANETREARILREIEEGLEGVRILDEDRILRRF